jgi:hypothetical protein
MGKGRDKASFVNGLMRSCNIATMAMSLASFLSLL